MVTQNSIFTFFESALREDPQKIVIVDQGKNISNIQLYNRILDVLCVLQETGVKKGCFVGVHLKPGFDLIAILLAITKMGAIFVPLETSVPKERLAFMSKDAGIACLITTDPDFGTQPFVDCPKVLLSSILTIENQDIEPENVLLAPKDTCYVIYTSGTTGIPKGVLANFAGAINTIVQSARIMDIQPSHRLLQLSPISFDVFFLEVGMTLYAGATIVFFDGVNKDNLEEVMIENEIQHILCTPNFVTATDLNKTVLHTVMFGGEPMPNVLLEKYLGHFNVVHAYGVTEATICSTLELCDGNYPVPIGHPLEKTCLEILDEQQQPVDIGIPGEIVLSGVGISNGYINRPEVNEERFIDDTRQPGNKKFRTGDMAKKDEKGNIFFLGRSDRQIKYREHRLEVFEMEAILLNHINVSQAAVLLDSDQLWAFVCLDDMKIKNVDLIYYLSQHYPKELIPKIKLLANIPLTNHNKVNYSKLKEMLI